MIYLEIGLDRVLESCFLESRHGCIQSEPSTLRLSIARVVDTPERHNIPYEPTPCSVKPLSESSCLEDVDTSTVQSAVDWVLRYQHQQRHL